MNLDMTQPCVNCPFRRDVRGYLTRARAHEIAAALLSDASFTCHKTIATEEDDEGECFTVETPDSQHCAGALIFLEAQERPNQMMRWMERIGCYDRSKLNMAAPVFTTAHDFIAHHGRAIRDA